MCPGNRRATGATTPAYTGTYVFDNDYPALLPDTAEPEMHQVAQGRELSSANDNNLLVARPEMGICRVVCFSPRHDLTVAKMERSDLRRVVNVWTEQYHALGALPFINHVQIFENRGAIMGCSNPHPHGQIWANATIPNEPAKEFLSQHEYLEEHHSLLLMDYLKEEQSSSERIIRANNSFTALVPFWAVWPFEVMILANQPVRSLPELSELQIKDLAALFLDVTRRYDNLFGVSFPYSMGFHQAPCDGKDHAEWVLHVHFYPPLLRSATVRKFMVGYELMAMPQRDLTPETAAERLRSIEIEEVS